MPVLTKEDEYGESMNNELIACCGLDCGECDARRATLLNDDGLREETARRWSVMNGTPEITSATIDCMGCRTEGVKFAYCNGMCSIRRCVSEKGYETCGDCPSMECCPMVGAVLRHAPGAKTNLLSVGRLSGEERGAI